MLEGVDTGYEGKFDFPRRARPPDRTYLLATVPRTGSTYLTHLLWGTGCLGAPLEYLNFDPAGPYGFAARSAELQADLWHSVLRRRTSPNSVFGLKAFPPQLEALTELNPPLLQEVLGGILRGSEPRVVRLRRRDRAAHEISYARATLSGVWRQEQEKGAAEIPFSEEALRKAGRWIDIQESAWDQMFGDLGLQPLELSYEEVAAAPDQAVARVAEYLGVELRPEARIEVPIIRQQDRSDAERWLAKLGARGAPSS
jgi:LPS sulfotransferase NodH